jgi:cellobiose-specific phosphotransferase system component IIC
MFTRLKDAWGRFATARPGVAQFVVFFVLSNGITVLQLAMMPLIKWLFGMTSLVDTSFQVWPIGSNPDGSQYFVFDYAAGPLPGGGGGLAYFLAVQITLLVAQVINFFAQRSITFKSNSSVVKAASWYAAAYVVITLVAAALQGLYKAPIYDLFIDTWGLGGTGETLADFVTMIINAAISFWVFFPIFKVIFKQVPEEAEVAASADASGVRPA